MGQLEQQRVDVTVAARWTATRDACHHRMGGLINDV